MNTELKVGQVYLEDLGGERFPNRLTIETLDSNLVGYYLLSSTYGSSYEMPRGQFESLIRARVLLLWKDNSASPEIEKALKLEVSRLQEELNEVKCELRKDSGCASLHYQNGQTKVLLAQEERERAGCELTLAQIRCRAAELECQHEPLAALLKRLGIEVGSADYAPIRKAMLEAVRFAVFGRLT